MDAIVTKSSADEVSVTQSSARGWYVVSLLCGLFIFSFVDRLILSLLTAGIGQDLNVSDTQLGLLIGTSFAVVYSLAGIPLAHFLDRTNRKRILVAGVVLWSGMTIASGFATSFGMLAVFRAGVALGEAVLTPAAVSLIADMFPREKRVLPTAVYAAMSSLMGVGGLVIGAAALQLAESVSPSVGLAPWRIVLVIAGLPALMLAILFALTVREPVRGRFDGSDAVRMEDSGFGAFLTYLRSNAAFYLPFYLGTALVVTYLFGIMTWTPTLLIRGHGADAASAGYSFGLVGMSFGLLGAIFWPRLVVVLGRRGWRDPIILGLVLGCLVGAPVMTLAPAMPSQALLLGGMGVVVFMGASIASLLPIAIQTYGPPHLRARLMSFVMLSQSLIGYGLGPPLIAKIAGRWEGEGMAFGYALLIAGLAMTPAAGFCYFCARRALARAPLP